MQPETQTPARLTGIRPSLNSTLAMASIALSMCVLAYTIQTNQGNYQARFFVLWISHSSFVAVLPIYILYLKLSRTYTSHASLKDDVFEGLARLYVKSHSSSANNQYTAILGSEQIEMNNSVCPTAQTNSQPANSQIPLLSPTQESFDGNSPTIKPDSFYHTTTDYIDEPENDPLPGPSQPNGFSIQDEPTEEKKFDSAVKYVIANKKLPVILYSIMVYGLLSYSLNIFSYLWYLALDFTTISKITAIYNTSPFFAYLFSVLILKHDLKAGKIFAVLVSIVGVFVMSFYHNNDQKSSQNKTSKEGFGDLIVFLCAIGTGLTQTLYGKYIKPPNFHSMMFVNFSTFSLGLATFLLNWIPVVLLHFFKIEPFSLPTLLQLKFIGINALFGLVYNASFIIVLSLTSPMFAAVGVMLTIPVSAFIEVFFESHPIALNVIVGGIFVLAGFALLSYIQYKEVAHESA
ncbi:hypothetical protein BB558_001148 [Smittium angustum]|uniref:EamA domain-containing protein n=1 Tax=Smittium angustum TaxID=133377 RepID=A0A2U1JCG0_SMIAN|nr:hypothetical protein BB558_001148 [Smittium angustum]